MRGIQGSSLHCTPWLPMCIELVMLATPHPLANTLILTREYGVKREDLPTSGLLIIDQRAGY
jgi:hypothetical protein